MIRALLASTVAVALLVANGNAAENKPVARYHLENAWPSKATGQKKGLKAKPTTRRKESTEKGGTQDINIGVGELQGKSGPKLKSK